uniref:Uncharacterized protein n=1 Tax=Utricularia reniformis TaxID=192314 RepID=A0A1Y0B1X9_9LAMI|nr:hypothetical protein AEK19_MT1184 [Utricularia reniformis]ART31397.1 hypothetical protein AEK19_MT1184 [Utricularia reniformis]
MKAKKEDLDWRSNSFQYFPPFFFDNESTSFSAVLSEKSIRSFFRKILAAFFVDIIPPMEGNSLLLRPDFERIQFPHSRRHRVLEIRSLFGDFLSNSELVA